MKRISIGCVVMAAGAAARFGENKLAAVVRGKPLLEHALDAVPADALDAVCVVTRFAEAERLAARYGFAVVRNDRPQDGLSRTVRLGTQALQDKCDAILFMVSDQPMLRRESVRALLDFFRQHPDRIVAASHDGRRGNPCVFARQYYGELCQLAGDVGGSAVIRAHGDALLLFEVGERELLDVDTKDALNALKE